MKQACTIVFIIGSMVLLSNCRYDNIIVPSGNIILHDKPLDVIRANIQYHWKLLFSRGGFAGGTYYAKHNEYMNISGDRIVFGDDFGVTLDTIIVWKRDIDISNEYTYLMGLPAPPGYPGGLIYESVDRIQNDTLILVDDAYDPSYYYYLSSAIK